MTKAIQTFLIATLMMLTLTTFALLASGQSVQQVQGGYRVNNVRTRR